MNSYNNPADKFLLMIFIICIIIPTTPLLYVLINPSFLYAYLFFISVALILICISIYLIYRLVLLRPISIEINNNKIIFFYHFSQPLVVTWNDIEWIVKFEGNDHSLLGKIDHGGKIKLRNQRWPFYSSYEIAKAFMDEYKGPGQLKKVGNAWIIE